MEKCQYSTYILWRLILSQLLFASYTQVETNRRKENGRVGYLFKATLAQPLGQSPKGFVWHTPKQTILHRSIAVLLNSDRKKKVNDYCLREAEYLHSSITKVKLLKHSISKFPSIAAIFSWALTYAWQTGEKGSVSPALTKTKETNAHLWCYNRMESTMIITGK